MILFAISSVSSINVGLVTADNIQSDNVCNKLKSFSVKVLAENNSWGTGIIFNRIGLQYTIITNGHVLIGNKDEYIIETSDRKQHRAFVFARFDQHKDFGNDIALLKFNSTENYQLASFSNWNSGEKVLAAGFPTNLPATSPNSFVCTQFGNVSYKLERSMKKGYQLGYYLSVFPGMSGGPLVNEKGDVIGINGMGDPALFINPEVYLFRNNDKVSETIGKKFNVSESEALRQLSLSGWAIPTEVLTSEILPNLPNTSPKIIPDPAIVVAHQSLATKTSLLNNSISLSSDLPQIDKEITDKARELLVSIGLVENINGRIVVDPTAAAVIVSKKGKTYYVLTKAKSIISQYQYGVITADGQNHKAQIFLKDVANDLAILTFNSDLLYKSAKLGDLEKLSVQMPIYILGWTKIGRLRQAILFQSELNDIDSLIARKVFSYINKSNSSLGSGFILGADGALLGLNNRIYEDNQLGEGISVHHFLNSFISDIKEIN